jgi:hypothetical protein
MRAVLVALGVVLLSSCQSHCGCRESQTAAAAAPERIAAPPTAPAPSATVGATPDEPPPATTAAPEASAPTVETRSLPEVIVRNVGLHVGGGPNDETTKAPFKRAVEPHFDDLRRCYTKIGEPGKGGVIGVDFQIPREGGKAQVSELRTGMKGPEFRDCVKAVFQTVTFEKPSKPTVISYSVEYSLASK